MCGHSRTIPKKLDDIATSPYDIYYVTCSTCGHSWLEIPLEPPPKPNRKTQPEIEP